MEELLGDPDILDILVFGDIWVIHSIFLVVVSFIPQMFAIMEAPLETPFRRIT